MINYNVPTPRERLIASLCHLSPLIPLFLIILFIFTGLGQGWILVLFFSRLVFPLMFWHIGKNNPWIINHAKNCLNFQITQTFIIFSTSIIYLALIASNTAFDMIGGFWFILQIVILFAHVMLAANASMIAQNSIDETGKIRDLPNYPLTIPFLKSRRISREIVELSEEDSQSLNFNNHPAKHFNKAKRLILAIPISLVIVFICFIVSLIWGKNIAGQQIYDYSSNAEGEWRYENEDSSIIAITAYHLFFWIAIIVANKYLTKANILVAIMISLPYLFLLVNSWWIIMLFIVLGAF